MRINLGEELNRNYGTHRSGWAYAVDCLAPLHDPKAPKLISFIEKKFIFGSEVGDANNSFEEVDYPWVGFLHVPATVPVWFNGHYAPKALFESSRFQRAMQHCVAMFSLSSPLSRWISSRYSGPVYTALHPTERAELVFDPEILREGRKINIVQLGFWLRKMHAIYQLELPDSLFSKKIVGINKQYQKQMMRSEKHILGLENYNEDVEFIDFLDHQQYDELLSNSIVFVDFYDTSANNAIVECISRGVPIICPPMAAVVDYLGLEYPLYFRDYTHAAQIAQTPSLLREAHYYLMSEVVQTRIAGIKFLQTVSEAAIP